MTAWKTLGVIALLTASAAPMTAQAETQPYAGQEQRAIAALSAQDIDDLIAGRGWGFALPAELNGYPGPSHVFELADELELSTDQLARIEAIFAAMQAEAQALGAEYVAAEAALDAAFAESVITQAQLRQLIARAAEIEAELRAVHLAAHLETTPILTRHQTVLYNRARGYDSGGGHGGHSDH